MLMQRTAPGAHTSKKLLDRFSLCESAVPIYSTCYRRHACMLLNDIEAAGLSAIICDEVSQNLLRDSGFLQ